MEKILLVNFYQADIALARLVKDRQPQGVYSRRGPFDAMAHMRGNIDVVARTKVHDRAVVRKAQAGGSLDQHDPFVLVLVIPEAGGRRMSMRDDAFDPGCAGSNEGFDNFSRQLCRNVVQQVGSFHRTHLWLTGGHSINLRRVR